ncbi:ABC transporter permease [Chitinimonas sp.]|uniref:ABC transporter permease n=1 Tax=Chitinimonas sp. TaxID=1934313 RepID=UPI002F947D98
MSKTSLTLPALASTSRRQPLRLALSPAFKRALLGLALPLGLLAALELASQLGWYRSNLLPPPSELLGTLAELWRQGLLKHLVASTLRVAVGFAIGTAAGMVLGGLVGLSRRAEALLDPSVQAIRAIPSLAWVPLLLLWLGIDEAPKIVLIALGAFFPVYLGLVAGIRDVDRRWVELGTIYGLHGWPLVRRILLPASLPALFTGLRGGLGLAWMFMVAAELIAATKGLGYLLTDGRETSRPDIVLTAIVLLALLGKLSDGILKALERRQLAWRDSFKA